MSNDFWHQQGQNGYNAPQHNGNSNPHSGSLLRDYRQQQGFQQYAPAPVSPVPESSPYSPMPQPGPSPQQQSWPSPQSWPSSSPTTGQQNQGWVANTVQSARRWSGRIARVPAAPPVNQQPLVLYRPSAPPLRPKSQRWKRLECRQDCGKRE